MRKPTNTSHLLSLVVALLMSVPGCFPDDGANTAAKTGSALDLANFCPIPKAPTLAVIHQGAELVFTADGDGLIQTGTTLESGTYEPDEWFETNRVVLSQIGTVNVFARVTGVECEPFPVSALYDVRLAYPPNPEQEGTTAVAMDSEAFIGWATTVESIEYGEEVDEAWRTPEKSIGPADGTTGGVVSLGRGGTITLEFHNAIRNGIGFDFAVFENSFSKSFLELAYVEVSSDNTVFLRFDCAFASSESVSGFGTGDTTMIGSLAGKYGKGFGTPFDLEVLAGSYEVLTGEVDLDSIKYVRLVDIVGDGTALDSFGNVIYDPFPTVDSAGFDLDAVGVLNQQ
jgi:hypothetical protein